MGRYEKTRTWEQQKEIVKGWLKFSNVDAGDWEKKADEAKAELEKFVKENDGLNLNKLIVANGKYFEINREYWGNRDFKITYLQKSNGEKAGIVRVGSYNIDTNGLTDEQISNIVAIASVLKHHSVPPTKCVYGYDEYVELGRTKYVEDGRTTSMTTEFDKNLFSVLLPGTEVDLEPPKVDFLSKVAYVWEHKNNRYAGILKQDSRYGNIGGGWNLINMKFEHNHDAYNYLDKGRLCYIRYSSSSAIKFLWDDLKEEMVEQEFLNKLEDFTLITADIYKQAVRKFELKVLQDKKEKALKDKMRKDVESRFDDDGINFKPFTHSEISFNKYWFEYANQKVGFNNKPFEEANSMMDFYENIKFEEERLDFNELYLKFVQHLINYRSKGEFSIFVGDFKIDYGQQESSNGAKLAYINDKRINNAEVKEVLEHALCFETQADYDGFIQKISKCSLRFHNFIASGLIVQVVPLGGSSYSYHDKDLMTCRFNMKRLKNRNYLYYFKENEAGEKVEVECPIGDTNKLLASLKFNSNRYGRQAVAFDELADAFLVQLDVGSEKFHEILQDAIKEHKRIIKRSEELLANTIKTLGVKKMSVNSKDGYLVKGKLTNYFVDDDGKVYKHPSMSYVCMVEKTGVKRVGNDLIVNRLYALANDSVLVKEISTLR